MDIRRTSFGVIVLLLLGAFGLWIVMPQKTNAQFVQTITLISGNGVIGSADSTNEFSINNGVTWNPAIVVAPGQFGYPANTGYDTIAGTNYIARSASGATPNNALTIFRTFFTLPPNFIIPWLTAQVHADNKATLFLNGTPIAGAQPCCPQSNFQNPPEGYGTANPNLFQVGQNVLEMYVQNQGGPSAIDYKAEVSFLTKPGATLPSACANPTIVGTPGNDAIVAVGGPNVIDGMGGNDAIVTGPFNDIICGGAGNDRIASGGGNDIIYGGLGDDLLFGDSGNDAILGEQGDDSLNGGTGIDACFDPFGSNTYSMCP